MATGHACEAIPECAEFNAARLYFRQIARVPLLEPDEERTLCRQIEAAHAALAAVPAETRSAPTRAAFRVRPGRDDRSPPVIQTALALFTELLGLLLSTYRSRTQLAAEILFLRKPLAS